MITFCSIVLMSRLFIKGIELAVPAKSAGRPGVMSRPFFNFLI